MSAWEDEVLVGEVANEIEAQLVVDMLLRHGIAARSDASSTGPLFGGALFDPGHRVFVQVNAAKRAREILEHHPHFKPHPHD